MKKKTRSSLFTLAAMMVMLCFMHITVFAAESVTEVKQVADTETSVSIEWASISGARYYGIQWSTRSDFSTIAGQKEIFVGTNMKIENLTSNVVYYVRVGYGEDSTNCFQNFSAPIEVVTTPAKPEVSFVDADTNTVTVSWSAVEGATSYIVTYNDKEYATADTKMQLTYEWDTSKKMGVSTANVKSVRTSAAGYEAKSADGAVEGLCSLTKKIKKSKFTVTDVRLTANFAVSDVCGDKVELECYDLKTKKKKKIASGVFGGGSMPSLKGLKSGHSYKYRVRASVTFTDGTKKTGEWSDYNYLVSVKGMGVQYTAKNPSTKTVKWKKLTGVSKIKIELSHKRDSGYKKVATIKGTKTSYTFKKLSLNKSNYVRFTYYVKVGKKTQKANVIIINLESGA